MEIALESARGVRDASDVGVDFVGDPIGFEEESEERAERKQRPAESRRCTEASVLESQVEQVRGRVANVGQERGDDKEEQ